MKRSFTKYLCLIFSVLYISLTGCVKKVPLPESYVNMIKEFKAGDIVHTRTGYKISEKDLMEILKGSRVIYIGETHDNTESHRIQLEIIKKLYEMYPDKIAVGMEMFGKPYQPVLDKWSAGELSEKDFVIESKWYFNWKTNYRYYGDILSFIKEKHLSMLALDVSKELMSEISAGGIESVSDAYKKHIPKMDTEDPYYRSTMKAYFSGHSTTGKGLEMFIKIQTIRDEIMADTIVDFLTKDANREKKIVILTGGGHVRYGFGIPRRVFRQLPVPYTIILSDEVSIPEDKKDKIMDVKLPDLPIPEADIMWMIEYKDLDNETIRFGMIIDDTKSKLKVEYVIPKSLAEKIGIKKDDIILKFNNEPLAETSELLYLLDKEKPGNAASLELLRDGKELKMDITMTVEKLNKK